MKVPQALLHQFGQLAKEHGEMVLLQGCLEVVRTYAERGAAATLTKRRGRSEEPCERCRKRDALIEQTAEVLGRCADKRPLGPSTASPVRED